MNITLDSIENLVSSAHRYENYLAIVCPYHDDTKPSLLAYNPRTKSERGYFHCKACGTSGNLEMLYNALQGWVPPKSLRYERTSYDAPSLPQSREEQEDFVLQAHRILKKYPDKLGWYLADRGVEGCIQVAELGWFDGWIVLPIRDRHGNLEGLIMRSTPPVQKTSNIRFHQPKGQKPLFYAPDRALIERSPKVAVVYGMFDTLALTALRLPVVTTTAGKDSFKPEWLDEYRKPVVVIPDSGEEVTAKKLASKLGWRGSVLELPYTETIKDPADYLMQGKEEELLKLLYPELRGE